MSSTGIRLLMALFIVIGTFRMTSAQEKNKIPPTRTTLSRPDFSLPEWDQLVRVVLLRDYNTRVVLVGTVLLGVCSGVIGTFLLLRGRAMAGDVISHSALPGLAIAFLVGEAIDPGAGRVTSTLLIGAVISSLIGMGCANLVRRFTKLKEETVLAIVLSLFFGFGAMLLSIVQQIPSAQLAGLQNYIFGKAASMVYDDVVLIGVSAGIVVLLALLFFKELVILCFDEDFAETQGWPTKRLDLLLMGLVVCVTVIGLQSAGLLLVVALMMTPSAAARFWTDRIGWLTLTSAILGGASCYLGVLLSALFPRMATGAVIVLMGSLFFFVSLLLGLRRGLFWKWWHAIQLRQRVERADLLRACYEAAESLSISQENSGQPRELIDVVITVPQLLAYRNWSERRWNRLLTKAVGHELIVSLPDGGYRLTQGAIAESRRIVRNHRLWEMYLIHYADVAPSHVDRGADWIEHVLAPDVVDELTRLLNEPRDVVNVPESPHPLQPEMTGGGREER
ncbi:MAG: metal ABC transporter permease [Planctomycetota bacterium]|nr:metal ABC transporter permease [Planctomycetota bacterium]MDA1212499.1 metal ABC transporter permease [Planctomycetota bacterium]